jgi:hypothetical protein
VADGRLPLLWLERNGRPVVQDALAVYHDAASVVGAGCDDQFEFEFALDLLLDGLDRLR